MPSDVSAEPAEVQAIVSSLALIPHPEGGYFRETWRGGAEPMASRGKTDNGGELMSTVRRAGDGDEGQRNVMTSMLWMLTKQLPYGCWIQNASTHVHYHHGGGTIEYHVVTADGRLEKHRLGPNYQAGDVPQLIVPGGWLKCAQLVQGAWALIGEGVAPGFDFRDMKSVTAEQLKRACPEAFEAAGALIDPKSADNTDAFYERK
ncbi:unnamed protein product [Pedinophyceae sp. YPF-701]|nr:unnamed protein product [Pedinophyceae sp. YPF-701]